MVFRLRQDTRDGVPTLPLLTDYRSFRWTSTSWGRRSSRTSVTHFTAIDIRTQMAMRILVPSKSVNRYAWTALKGFIHETARTHAVREMDGEYSIKALAKACASEIGSRTMRVAPMASPQSQGVIDRFRYTDRNRANIGQNGLSSASESPKSGIKFEAFARVWSNSATGWPKSGGPPKPAKNCPNPGHMWPKSGQIRKMVPPKRWPQNWKVFQMSIATMRCEVSQASRHGPIRRLWGLVQGGGRKWVTERVGQLGLQHRASFTGIRASKS